MVGATTDAGATLSAVGSNKTVAFRWLDDFVGVSELQQPADQFEADAIFVGHGIVAPEFKWDDFKGVDVKGKVLVLFTNEPPSEDPKFFGGHALTYYGRWTYKYEETARHGAVATLIIHRTDLASYGWDVVRNSWGAERSYLQNDGTPKLQAASWIQLEVAKKLAAMGGLDLDKLYKEAQSRDFKPIELPVKLKAHVASEVRPFTSRNVVAILNGANQPREAVLYTAHYDHFGIDKNRPAGDNIYHGAIDNATGCGILLEIARVWAGTKPTPPRSILFAAVTAEEQGLLGSEYLGKHAAQLPAQPILDLNFDALAPLGVPEEVEVAGAERTTFYPTVEKIAKDYGLAIKPDAHPEAGHYYRSDHFSLSRVGIPSFSISEGMKFQGHDLAWGEAQAKDYVTSHYHKPSDEFHAGWDFQGLGMMASFGYELGAAAASQSEAIRWLPGDEFEKAQRRVESRAIDGDALFAGRTDLRPVSLEAIRYPPLARQTRIFGTVLVEVTVSSDGSAEKTQVVSGHPILVAGVE
jgi:Zn-dependent M28 family amino/carboxypeptidase